MVTLLRDDEEAADRAPTPGIDQIGQLVDAVSEADLRISLDVDGSTESVPRTVGTAAYRIVQESLTNVIRHAGASTVRVTVRAGGDRILMVEVCDDGAVAPSGSAGLGIGIRGMRERAESTGGRVTAGSAASGGFTVRAIWDGR
jgi:signal transduction histidine kinase